MEGVICGLMYCIVRACGSGVFLWIVFTRHMYSFWFGGLGLVSVSVSVRVSCLV